MSTVPSQHASSPKYAIYKHLSSPFKELRNWLVMSGSLIDAKWLYFNNQDILENPRTPLTQWAIPREDRRVRFTASFNSRLLRSVWSVRDMYAAKNYCLQSTTVIAIIESKPPFEKDQRHKPSIPGIFNATIRKCRGNHAITPRSLDTWSNFSPPSSKLPPEGHKPY